ncbi:MAG: hypothetical protein ACM33T_09500 [Solirubrobacterales bacterium]
MAVETHNYKGYEVAITDRTDTGTIPDGASFYTYWYIGNSSKILSYSEVLGSEWVYHYYNVNHKDVSVGSRTIFSGAEFTYYKNGFIIIGDLSFDGEISKVGGNPSFTVSYYAYDVTTGVLQTLATGAGSAGVSSFVYNGGDTDPYVIGFGEKFAPFYLNRPGWTEGPDQFPFDPGKFPNVSNYLSQANIIDALGGDDFVNSGKGNDTVYGGDGADTLYGDFGDDKLFGGAGNDTLDGGGNKDVLTGGVGDDVYRLWSTNEKVVELPGEGKDTVIFSGYFNQNKCTLPDNVEDLVLTDAPKGALLKGNSLSNTIAGFTGNDTIIGEGGEDVVAMHGMRDNYGISRKSNTEFQFVSLVDGTDVVSGVEVIRFLDCDVNVRDLMNVPSKFDDLLRGTDGVDILGGLEGNDTLDGGIGADTLEGGAGDDVYVVDDLGDVVSEAASAGRDTVRTSLGAYTLGANLESLEYTGAGDFAGTGNDLVNVLTGGDGNDILDGGKGADTLIGGAGNDVYVIDDAKDGVRDSGGSDTIRTAMASFSLAKLAAIETLQYTGAGAFVGTGNDFANTIIGGGGKDTLIGGKGDDRLVAMGGGDRLDGGDGDGDVAVLQAGGWTVSRKSATETLLTKGGDVVSLTGIEWLEFGGEAPVSWTSLIANVASDFNDVFTADGIAGRYAGGKGDDAYAVDDFADEVQELAGGGIDLVDCKLAIYTLPDQVERLAFSGDGPFEGHGNALANIITGGSGADLLDGGAGADTLIGGSGADTYRVDNAKDVVIETSGSDIDIIETALAKFSLSKIAMVETLVYGGAAGFTGTGNDLDNTVRGGAGKDVLAGGGGNDRLVGLGGDDQLKGEAGDDTLEGGGGNDTLTGGTGADRFVFAQPSDGKDMVTDFQHAFDKIAISVAGFDGDLTAGALPAEAFFIGAPADSQDAALRFVSDGKTLWYEPDGNAAHAVAIATFSKAVTLTADDLLLI